MRNENSKGIGLVLSGGGAKGAYQVGVIKAMAELGIEVSAIAGASIGALNGAVLSCAGSIGTGAGRLLALWRAIAENPPLEENDPMLLRVMEALGLKVDKEFKNIAIVGKEMRQNLLPTALRPTESGLISEDVIHRALAEYICDDRLANGIPLYVSVFPARAPIEAIIGCSLALLGIKDTPESEFLLIQTLEPEERRKALLASAALPFLLKTQEIHGQLYLDGGVGGFKSAQGNTPVAPLLQAGFDPIIVTVLTDRPKWKKGTFFSDGGTTIIEVERFSEDERPLLIAEAIDVLRFTPDRIYERIERGYRDSLRSLEPRLSVLR